MFIYLVRSGDTLHSIASANQTSTDELYRLNGMPNPENLVVGQSILIPSDAPLSDYPRSAVFINGYVYDTLNPDQLTPVMPSLSSLSIFSYGFHADGTLIPSNDTALLELAARYQAAPVLVLTAIDENGSFESSHAAVLLNRPEARRTLLYLLRDEMLQKGYQGLDIDFEYIAPSEQDGYFALVREAVQIMNEAGITVNTALAPKTSAAQKGLLYESHNYNIVGSVSNTVLLMTYEWGYTLLHV